MNNNKNLLTLSSLLFFLYAFYRVISLIRMCVISHVYFLSVFASIIHIAAAVLLGLGMLKNQIKIAGIGALLIPVYKLFYYSINLIRGYRLTFRYYNITDYLWVIGFCLLAIYFLRDEKTRPLYYTGLGILGLEWLLSVIYYRFNWSFFFGLVLLGGFVVYMLSELKPGGMEFSPNITLRGTPNDRGGFSDEVLKKLTSLKALYDSGVITKDELTEKCNVLLGRQVSAPADVVPSVESPITVEPSSPVEL